MYNTSLAYEFVSFPKLYATTTESKYSMSHECDAYLTSIIIMSYIQQPKNSTIVDATANVGGNVYSFAHYFKNVFALEPNKIHYENLVQNISHLNNVTAINSSYESGIKSVNDYDVIFYDAPWGGFLYKNKIAISLFLGGKSLLQIAKYELTKCNIVALKVPTNFNFFELTHIFSNNNFYIDVYQIKLTYKNSRPLYNIVVLSKNPTLYDVKGIYKLRERFFQIS